MILKKNRQQYDQVSERAVHSANDRVFKPHNDYIVVTWGIALLNSISPACNKSLLCQQYR